MVVGFQKAMWPTKCKVWSLFGPWFEQYFWEKAFLRPLSRLWDTLICHMRRRTRGNLFVACHVIWGHPWLILASGEQTGLRFGASAKPLVSDKAPCPYGCDQRSDGPILSGHRPVDSLAQGLAWGSVRSLEPRGINVFVIFYMLIFLWDLNPFKSQ